MIRDEEKDRRRKMTAYNGKDINRNSDKWVEESESDSWEVMRGGEIEKCKE